MLFVMVVLVMMDDGDNADDGDGGCNADDGGIAFQICQFFMGRYPS